MTQHPHPLGDVRRHLTLVRDMAKATGTDTVAAFDEGRLTSEDWVDVVMRCRDCKVGSECRAWLDAPLPWPRAIPAACANHGTFTRLQAGQLRR